jgi:hypothetical protein
MGKLEGTVSISNLPPHRGLIVNLCFYGVDGPEAPAPHGGDPPAEAATDCQKIAEDVHPERESREATFERPFRIEHAIGWYYVQLRVILFREKDGANFAQVEPFFFSRRPLPIADEVLGQVELPVSWPAIPLEQLHHYGTLTPRSPKTGTGPTPPTPLWLVVLMFPLSLGIIGAAVVFLYHALFADKPPGMMYVNPVFSLLMLAAGVAGLIAGCKTVFRRIVGARRVPPSSAPVEDRPASG